MAGTDDPRTEAVQALEAEFGELINQFRRLISEQAGRISPGMLPGAYKVFMTIVRRKTITLSALADALYMDKGQLSRTVRELEQLGLVRREPDPRDGRASLLSPTAEGLSRLDATRSARGNPLHEALEGWDLADIRTLTRLMHALVRGESPRT